MESEVTQKHWTDENDNPAGGWTEGRGFSIDWQNGPLSVDGVRREPTGAFVEDVIQAAIGRIEYYQGSKFHSLANAVALGHLYAAREALRERTRDRESRGVEGTHQKPEKQQGPLNVMSLSAREWRERHRYTPMQLATYGSHCYEIWL